jgi:hypothetical protein
MRTGFFAKYSPEEVKKKIWKSWSYFQSVEPRREIRAIRVPDYSLVRD